MKLSEKLAALEQEESREAADATAAAPSPPSAGVVKRARATKARAASTEAGTAIAGTTPGQDLSTHEIDSDVPSVAKEETP